MILAEERVRRVRRLRIIEDLVLVVAVDDSARRLHELRAGRLEQRLEVRLERRVDEDRDRVLQFLDEAPEPWDFFDRILDALNNAVAE
jgi:hypothetical protein